MQPFYRLNSPVLHLPSDHIDTDQIIPARFLTQSHKQGLGALAFYDWRYDEGGQLRVEHILNQAASRSCQILLAGKNFGCGSSREHAVWALQDYGFRVVISPSLGDIFRSNAIKNGLLPIEVDLDFYQTLAAPSAAPVEVDLEAQKLTLASGVFTRFSIDPFARQCLLQGVDQLGYLLTMQAAITAYEKQESVQ